jgi:hypothetical protein
MLIIEYKVCENTLAIVTRVRGRGRKLIRLHDVQPRVQSVHSGESQGNSQLESHSGSLSTQISTKCPNFCTHFLK